MRTRFGYQFRGKSPSHLYRGMLSAVWADGAVTSPRDMPTKELLHTTTIIEEPLARLLLCPQRNLNPFFLVAEALWILAGRADAAFITFYNSKLNQFLDPEVSTYFHGAYGERIRRFGRCSQWYVMDRAYEKQLTTIDIDQMETVIKILKGDADSRRAVITLWHPHLDKWPSNDIPCNDMIFFKIRDGKLCMTVCNRSNDLNLGFPSTNVFQFTIIQEALASILKVEPGTYTHYSDSLHLYEDDPITKRILSVETPGYYEPPVCPFYRMDLLDLRGMDGMLSKLFEVEDYWREMGGEMNVTKVMFEVNKFRGWAGVFGDFLLYLNIYILYKRRRYERVRDCLCELVDFNLFLGGLEFLRRAIKTDYGRAVVFDKVLDVELEKRVRRQWDDSWMDVMDSARFFLSGGRE